MPAPPVPFGVPAQFRGQTLSTYQPTFREAATDLLRRALFSDDRAGQRKAERVSNVLETVTPFGFATGIDDMKEAVGQGDYATAGMMGAMAFVPGPSVKRFKGYKGMHPYTEEGALIDLRKGREQHSWHDPNSPYASKNAGFFASNPEVASYFADATTNSGGAVFPTNVSFNNPLVIDGQGRHASEFQFGKNSGWGDEWKAYFSDPKYADYDGVILKNVKDAGGVTDIYVPKDPEQLQSVFESPKIKAYHGSPHSFDKFSMDKIGTGEGAQAYGHGLYFAESEGVAKSYKDQLKRGDNNSIVHIGDRDFPSDMGNYYLRQETERALPPDRTNFVSGKQTYDHYNKELGDAAYKALKKAEHTQDPVAVMSAAIDEKIAKLAPYDDELPSVLAMKAAMLDHAKANIRLSPNGSMYEVSINASPDDFLDWDKPFANADEIERFAAKFDSVDPSIRKKIENWGYDRQQAGQPMPDGNDLIREVFGGIGSKDAQRGQQMLREAGIPGIKYLDAGSRGKGDGSRNYVVFDDKLIEIVRKYGIAGASAMAGYNILDGMDEAQAKELKKIDGSGW
jgi:hypothetical protein